jgi:DNA processing protein
LSISETGLAMNDEKIYQIAIGMIPGVGDILSKQLVSYCGSAKQVFNQSKAKLLKIPGVGEKLISQFNATEILLAAETELKKCDKNGIDVLFYTEPDYPSRLKKISDSPALLYKKGKGILEAEKTVAIVGTRNATPYGKEVTEAICADLATIGVTTISGLAYGIDIYAHRGSIKNNMPTFGVIASGLDWIYPSAHKNTSEEMQLEGGLISEHPLGTKPEAHYFPGRNRIIAGLCDALIVVETGEKGGSIITANIAFSYDKDIFAVPGNINNTYSKGCNTLIASQKALTYTCLKDLTNHMNWEAGAPISNTSKIDFSNFDETEINILSVLKGAQNGIQIDQLSWKTQLPINKLAAVLLNLEFGGVVKSLPGKKFKLA